MPDLPRFSRKEIRDVANWLVGRGWIFTDFDTKGHALFQWPGNGRTLSLPETPKRFHVQRFRAAALKIEGHQVLGKRNASAVREKAEAQRAKDRHEQEQRDQARQREWQRAQAAAARRRRERELSIAVANRRSELRSIAALMGSGAGRLI